MIYLCVFAMFLMAPTEKPKTEALVYIEAYQELAIAEMHRSGVPASIKMAQALHESNMGQSTLATQANNHFGIKCKKAWKGYTYYHKDDDLNKRGELIDSCFRSYLSSSDSWIDHSNFLKQRSNYFHLFFLDRKDYRAWANGLQRAGYATDKAYAQKIIKLIELYGLSDLDHAEDPFKKLKTAKRT